MTAISGEDLRKWDNITEANLDRVNIGWYPFKASYEKLCSQKHWTRTRKGSIRNHNRFSSKMIRVKMTTTQDVVNFLKFFDFIISWLTVYTSCDEAYQMVFR